MKEPDGFREFVDARSGGLLRLAWMMTGDAATAEDLLQTALVRTWPHWTKVAQGNPDAYVRKVMLRVNASWRSRRWHGERPTDHLGTDGVMARQPARDEHGRIDERLAMTTALATLPLRQRQAVVLRYYEDLSVEAVAELMGSSPGTVRSQCSKGLAKLRAALDEAGARERAIDVRGGER